MTFTAQDPEHAVPQRDAGGNRGRSTAQQRLSRGALVSIGVVVLLTFTRLVTGADELTRSGTFSAALRLAVPIALVGLGAIFSERAGVVNIGLEGMMILGTWFGGWAGWQFGPWWGVALGMAGGAAGGLVHAVATVTFGVDHIVSGVAVNILAGGVARYLSVIAFDAGSGGGASQSPAIQRSISDVDLAVVAGGRIFGWESPDALGWLERRRWVLVSDVAGVLRGVTGDLSWLTLVAVALVPMSAWMLWRTRLGLRLRSTGEHPAAAESLGVAVYRMKYLGVVVSGALAGLAGAFLVVEFAGIYREGQTGGRGFIGLATMIFGNWRPLGVAAGAGLFGFADALQLRDDDTVHAVLLVVALGLGAVAIHNLRRGHRLQSSVTAAIALLALGWFLVSDEVPRQFVFFTPHLTTLLVLALARRRSRMPAADGLRYRKGEVT